jgi:CheY-like chemotaxis protein
MIGYMEQGPAPAPPSAPRILIVTKEEALRAFVTRICAGAGFEVVQARWGDEALDLYRQHRPFRAVITDLLYDWSDWRLALRGDGKSVKHGLQLAAAIRRICPAQAIVLQTYAAINEVSKHLTHDLAHVKMLHKPFRPEALLGLLREEPLEGPRRRGAGKPPDTTAAV